MNVDKPYEAIAYPYCPDCKIKITEGHMYQCKTCPNVVCLNCVNMEWGINMCNACYAKDFVDLHLEEY